MLKAPYAFSPAALDVLAERQRQVTVEFRDAADDDRHTDGELTQAAAAYALGADVFWPANWSREYFKPKDRRRDLVRAAALLLAELDRLDRLEPTPPKPQNTLGSLTGVHCYWDASDREHGWSDLWQIIECHDVGQVVEIEAVAVVGVSYHARLEAARDSLTDDDFEVEAATEEEAAAQIKAELARREALEADEDEAAE